ncbi:MAG: 16S rRNA (cytosine(1402)-N(4))-methyltransferase RsmH [Candidatus Schekmanbacteria bacterium]|nr:16S rRNA (cytosine(1402)-N(4))-methyltransferase RsmH [Candidatus Schekmanbacteria bacterium]
MVRFHKPVMLNEVVQCFSAITDDVIVDGTLGGGGHSEEILKNLSDKGKLIGIDLDQEALAESANKLSSFGSKVKLVRGNFSDLGQILKDLKIEKVGGVLFDLGVSSHQFDSNVRGFSFVRDGALDMRMDTRSELNAFRLVNECSAHELKRIIKEYGEERWSGKIAAAIVQSRKKEEISSTHQLADIISNSIPRKFWPSRIHPATKTFQALRIAVNSELENLKQGLKAACSMLRKGGRICIISYHSLEDRIVKKFIAQEEKGCICPPEFIKCVCGKEQTLKRINRKPLRPSPEEVAQNPRARSALLRMAEKVS